MYQLLCILILCLSFTKAKIAILTMQIGENYIKTTHLGIVNKENYCQKHNYDFINNQENLDTTRPIPWSKILLINKHLPFYDWVFWTDADSLIMNYNIQLESLIDLNYDIVISKDTNGLNSGNFLIKNSEWSLTFLSQVYNLTQFINNPWWEQAAIMYQLKSNNSDYNKHVKYINQNLLNSYVKTFKKGDFIIHFPNTRVEYNLHSTMDKYYKLFLSYG